MKAWIGLGGNAEDSCELLSEALRRLGSTPGIGRPCTSRFFRTAPWGVPDQPDFVNAVAEVETDLSPEALLDVLLDVERALGRKRDGTRWGPRPIDLDLLACDELVVRTDRLILPHPRMHERAFVLVPLLELEPSFLIPGRGSAAHCLERLDSREVDSVTPLANQEEEN
ncbi:MAG: 2-amino-4-hydroxy-6-hydroxymethyldihydropteridine diphosphokinase [Lysobacterales bacterium]|jgi:2-amino-4-hydroxy-6-hydroxymethyldihydropteridine diphosphokinase